MDRRDFIRTSALATLGFAVACNRGPVPLAEEPGTLDDIQAGRDQSIDVRWSGVEVLSGRPERFTFTLAKPGGREPFVGASGNVWIAKSRTSGTAFGPFPIRPLGDGFERVGLYIATVTVPADDVYLALIDAKVGAGSAQVGQGQIVVGSTNKQVKPGARAPRIASPTVKNARGIDPYCTLKPKPCSMHAVSLDDALRSGKPTVAIVATPAFCASKLCGPEVQLLEHVAREAGDRANFIHIEVYRDDEADTIRKRLLAPAAAAWGLDIEPATYWIDEKGTVVDRALGPIDMQGFRDGTRALLA